MPLRPKIYPDCRQKRTEHTIKYKQNIAMTDCLQAGCCITRQSIIAIFFLYLWYTRFFSACIPGLVYLQLMPEGNSMVKITLLFTCEKASFESKNDICPILMYFSLSHFFFSKQDKYELAIKLTTTVKLHKEHEHCLHFRYFFILEEIILDPGKVSQSTPGLDLVSTQLSTSARLSPASVSANLLS